MNKRISFMLVMALVLGLVGTAYTQDLSDYKGRYQYFRPQMAVAGQPGQQFQVHCAVQWHPNLQHNRETGLFTVSFYASTNTIIEPGDYFLGEDHGSLPEYTGVYRYDDIWNSFYWSGDFPTNIPAGEYYVGWIIDRYAGVPENDESNNRVYIEEYKLIVKLENNPPVAGDDTYFTNANTTLRIPAPGVLGNDTDPDGDPLTAVKVRHCSHCGSLTFRADGSFTYDPAPGYTGADSFTYQAYDFHRYSNVATVTITVGAANQPPVASALAITPMSPTTVDNLVGSYTYSDADGDPESGTEIRWYKDGSLQSAYNDQSSVPSSATAAVEEWKFTVRPKDGVNFGALETSQTVTIQDTPATMVEVPDVVGLPLSQAEQAFWSAGFTTLYETYAHNDTVPQGHVIGQEPAGGELVPITSSPVIIISLGPDTGETTVEVPDVVGMSESDAESAINSAVLSVGTTSYQYDDTVPDGCVISQSPGAGTEVDPGTEVDLVISMGPEPEDVPPVPVPPVPVPPVPVPPVPVPPVPVPPDASCLLAHWKLDEIEGAIAYDSVGDNDGILYGDPIWQPMGGMLGGALEFNGSNVRVDAPYIPLDSRSFTITMWVNPVLYTNEQVVFSQVQTGSTNLSMHFRLNGNGSVRMGFYNNDLDTPGGIIEDNNWYHITFWYDFENQNRRIYIDGVQDTEASATPYLGTSGNTVIGSWGTSQWFQGIIDDVRIYDCAFDENQIKALISVTPSHDPLSEALDASLSFTTGGSADWFSQTTTTRYDGDAAQSPDISHNQESWMQTTVSGTGTVKFYWMVSSEEDFDCLEFYIDGSLQEKTSGSVNWQHKTYTISTSGSHTLEWRYVKDGGGNYGRDCGWVDKVEWVSTP